MRSALIFGYNEYSLEIATSLKSAFYDVSMFVFDDKEYKTLTLKGFRVAKFNLDDDFSDLSHRQDLEDVIVFCALEDTAQNIFLTISLRANFEDLIIIALSSDHESGRKLKMAGANKIIPITQTTVNMITEMIERPFVTKILNDILYSDKQLKIVQVAIKEDANIIGHLVEDVDWKYHYGLLVIAVIRDNLDTSFIFTKKANKEPLKEDDILVIIGYERDIEEFEKIMGRRHYGNRSDWSW
jgi:Trk K+ transport system NAD-binding subunit